MKLSEGIYEQVINGEYREELNEYCEDNKYVKKIDTAEASGIISQYIQNIIKKKLDICGEDGGILSQLETANRVIGTICDSDEHDKYLIDENAEQLFSIIDKNDPLAKIGRRKAKDMVRPDTSISQSSLFTGEKHEPQMYTELKKEIDSSDRIDIIVSFIRWSGLVKIIENLRKFVERGGELRVITTSYMGATEVKAIEELSKLPDTKIKISYDTERTRLHAKSYIFYRKTGYSTAYVGSSNISNVALSTGLEWNIKLTEKDMESVFKKIVFSFDSYWNNPEFEIYTVENLTKLKKALKRQNNKDPLSGSKYIFDINPYPYQQEILDKLKAEREIRGSYKNLVVAATGTGKTLISAFDYRDYVNNNPKKINRLLFVAHREEILVQSREVFRGVLKDPNFGQLYVGNNKPDSFDYLFISIQTMASQRLYELLDENYYDYIVVDEFHHAAANTYQGLLSVCKPEIMLGLTATPERMDGRDILGYFDGRIAAEIRLPEAIERKLLCPFQYFGVSDNVDLSEIQWTKGGYDKNELTNLYTLNRVIAERRASHIINSIYKYVSDIDEVHGLGFCVSKAHAEFMEDYFNSKGIPSISLKSDSADELRDSARHKLSSGEIKFIFVVDLYNEGVDIPEINTILFLRPTESLTVFLQQLGRGLRLSKGKDCLTVLDFIGQANRKYNFEEKYEALFYDSNHSLTSEIKNGFNSIPKGCYIQLEETASKIILDNIKHSFGDKNTLISRIKYFEEDTGKELTLENFLEHYHLSRKVIYKKFLFSRLCVEAGIRSEFDEPAEEVVTKAISKIVAIDSRRWIEFLTKNLSDISIESIKSMDSLKNRMMKMFYISIWNKVPDWEDIETISNIEKLRNSPIVIGEILDILNYNLSKIDFVDEKSDLGFDCPLDVHCTYTRDQLLVAMDCEDPSIREGVKWLPEKKIDVLLVTLNKSDKDYSPTTMYNDYSINDEMFHWQSQNKTSENSETGKRYINHRENESKIALFVRENKKDDYGTAPYTFLGTATYMSHTGNKPMSIVWHLDSKIPAKYLKKTNSMIIG